MMTLVHALIDTWAYLMVALICVSTTPRSWGWGWFGILGGVCWIGLIIMRWMEYNGA